MRGMRRSRWSDVVEGRLGLSSGWMYLYRYPFTEGVRKDVRWWLYSSCWTPLTTALRRICSPTHDGQRAEPYKELPI